MIKVKKISIPIYPVTVRLILWTDDNEFENYFKGISFEHPINSFDGGVFELDNKLYIVFNVSKKDYPTPGIIAHESKHLVNEIFDYVGHKLDVKNDEHECYLLEWIVNKVHEFLNKEK